MSRNAAEPLAFIHSNDDVNVRSVPTSAPSRFAHTLCADHDYTRSNGQNSLFWIFRNGLVMQRPLPPNQTILFFEGDLNFILKSLFTSRIYM